MPTLLFRLRNVPDDEANAVRQLLREHHIVFYETTAGAWGASTPGIWLPDGEDKAHAKTLIDRYEEERFVEERARYDALCRAGEHRTFLDILRENPWQVILYVGFAAFLLYISVKPFFDLGR